MTKPFVDTSGEIVTPIAFCFAKGAIASGTNLVVSGQSGLHVVRLAYWNDGSLRHAAVVGVWTPSSGNNSVAIATGTPTGSALSVSLPSDPVTVGTTTVNLTGGTLLRTWCATPDCVEKHYIIKISGTTIYVIWFVRWWSNGDIWRCIKIENNRDASGGPDRFTPWTGAIVAGGLNLDSSFTLGVNTAIYTEGWLVGSDPGTQYWQDPHALTDSKMAHNWIRRPGTLDDENDSTSGTYVYAGTRYAPLSRGNHGPDMSQGGFKPHIGVDTWWNSVAAKFSDPRGLAWAKSNALCLASYPMVFREPATMLPPKCTEVGVRGYSVEVGSAPSGGGTANGLTWEVNHAPNSPYKPYLLTGDYRFWELMQSQCAAILYYCSWLPRESFSTDRDMSDEMQSRGVFWSWRSFAETVATAPRGIGDAAVDAWADEYQAMLRYNVNLHYTAFSAGTYPSGYKPYGGGPAQVTQNELGFVATAMTEKLGKGNRFANVFLNAYGVLVAARMLDLGIWSDADRASFGLPLMHFLGRMPVGILGPGGTGYFCWDEVARDFHDQNGWWQFIRDDGGDDQASWTGAMTTWGEVWNVNYPGWRTAGTSIMGWSADGTGGTREPLDNTFFFASIGNWVLHAISRCVDYGVEGADAAFARFVGADNFSLLGSTPGVIALDPGLPAPLNWGGLPVEGVVPWSWVHGVPPTPTTVPGAPQTVTAVPGNTAAYVSFAAPASNGGSAITGYAVTSNPAGGVDAQTGTTATTHTMTGLTNGVPYTFTVRATNAIGQGSPSSASNSVTPDVSSPSPDWAEVHIGDVVGLTDTSGNSWTLDPSGHVLKNGTWLNGWITQTLISKWPSLFFDIGSDTYFEVNINTNSIVLLDEDPRLPPLVIPPTNPSLPDWLDVKPMSVWQRVTSGYLPDPEITPFSGAIFNTVGVYVGGVFTAGRFIVCWGGGHAASDNNAAYVTGPLDADASPPCFAYTRNTHVQSRWFGLPPNVFPCATHSYQHILFDAIRNKMASLGSGAPEPLSTATPADEDGSDATTMFALDFNDPDPMGNPWAKGSKNVGGPTEVMAAVDDVTPDVTWMLRGTGTLVKTTLADDPLNWTTQVYLGGGPGGITGTGCAVHNKVMVIWYQGTLYKIDLTNPSAGAVTLTPSGDGPPGTSGYLATVCWAGDKWTVFIDGRGRDLWHLDEALTTWTHEVTTRGVAPPHTSGGFGPYGRFGFAPGLGYYLMQRDGSFLFRRTVL